MALSSELISQFVKTTKDDKKTSNETTVYGTIVFDGRTYVRLDGAPDGVLTPVDTTVNVENGERVTVLIKDHTATVTGNLSYPSAKSSDVDSVAGKVDNLSSRADEFDVVIAHKVTADDVQATNGMFTNITAITGKYSELSAITAEFESLKAELIEGKTLKVDDIEAIHAELESIEVKFGGFTEIETEDLEAINAEITNLKGYTADFTYISAVNIDVKKLDAGKADIDFANISEAGIENLNARYVNINMANIDKAWIEELYSKSGLIEYVTADGVTVTGHLVGVTITGDLIEGGTIKADKLVIQGADGLYYKLNYEGGALSGDEVAKKVCYLVTYNPDTGEYTSTSETIADPDGDPYDDAYTIDGRRVYASDGVFYYVDVVYPEWADKSLHGSNITAKSITAEKVSITDLVAFGATIGGFKITDHSIHSVVKSDVLSTTRGVYLDNDGQFSLGDSSNYLRFYNEPQCEIKLGEDGEPFYLELDRNGGGDIVAIDGTTAEIVLVNDNLLNGVYVGLFDDGSIIYYTPREVGDTTIALEVDYVDNYKLEICAESILFGPNSKKSASNLRALSDYVKIETVVDEDSGDEKPCIELSEDDDKRNRRQTITNVKNTFVEGDVVKTEVGTDGVKTTDFNASGKITHNNLVWEFRANGNCGLSWKEATS